MLQKPVHEFHDIQSHLPPASALGFFILEDHLAVFESNDAAIADGHPEDIRGQVTDTVVTVGQGLAIDIEGFIPDSRINGVGHSGRLQLFLELGLEYFGHGFDRSKKIQP